MKSNTKSGLFLMEQLLAIVIFAVCAAICAAIFVEAYTTANNANNLNHALLKARNGAEVLKATSCLEDTASILGGYTYGENKTVVYYNNYWQTTHSHNAAFVLSLLNTEDTANMHKLAIHDASGEEIVAFDVSTKRRAMP